MAKAGGNDYMDIMQKEAERDAFGTVGDQCPLCGTVTGKLPWQTKEGMFERMYGMHYGCAKAASSAGSSVRQLEDFEKEWTALENIKAKKTGTEAAPAGSAGAKIQHALKRRLEEIQKAQGLQPIQPVSDEQIAAAAEALLAAPPATEAPAPAPAAVPVEAPAAEAPVAERKEPTAE